MFCPSCGNEIADNSKFCDHCGVETGGAAKPPTQDTPPTQETPPTEEPKQSEEKARTSDTKDSESPSDKETVPVVSASSGSRQFIPRDGKFDAVKWMKEGWEIVKADMATIVVFHLVFTIACAVLSGTGIGAIAVPGILAGYMLVLIGYLRRKEALDMGKMFSGGWNYFVDMLVFWLVGGIITSIGSLFLVIPGLIIGMGFWIAGFLIVDKKAKFGEAISAAFALISKQAMGLLVFALVLFVVWLIPSLIGMIPILGWLVLFAATLIIGPVTMIAMYKGYMEFFGDE